MSELDSTENPNKAPAANEFTHRLRSMFPADEPSANEGESEAGQDALDGAA